MRLFQISLLKFEVFSSLVRIIIKIVVLTVLGQKHELPGMQTKCDGHSRA